MTRMVEYSCGAFKVKVGAASGRRLQLLPVPEANGSVVGLGAYFPKDGVQPVSGTFNTFVRPADSGAKLSFYFCPTCGFSIFWEGGYSRSDVRGVAVGCFADPSFPPPQIAIYTENQHSWVTLPADAMPFETETTKTEMLALVEKLRGS